MTQEAAVFADLVRKRRATRQFLPAPLEPSLISAVLEDARQAPSNCNVQPWHVHVVSGSKRDELAAALLAAEAEERYTPDFFFDMNAYAGAPHVALLFMPQIGDAVRTAGDVGMYGQTFLLSLAAQGLAGIPQTFLGMFAETVRSVLGVPDEFKLMFGISFGRPDAEAPVNRLTVGRAPLSESVVFHR